MSTHGRHRVTLALSALLVTACGTSDATPTRDAATPEVSTDATASAPVEPGALGPGEELTIEFLGQANPNTIQHTEGDQPYIEDTMIPASNGRISVNLVTRDERSIAGQDVLRLLADGGVDIALFAFSFAAGDYPIMDAPDLAGLNPTGAQAAEMGDAWIPVINEELQGEGITFIASFPYPAQVVYCADEFSSFADLEGRTIRTFGVTLNDFVNVIGGETVSIASAEVYSALERGVIDCAISGTATGNSNAWYEVATHYLDLPLTWGLTAYAVNTEWWNGLEPDVQAFVDHHLRELTARQNELAQVISEDGSFCNQGLADQCEYGSLAPPEHAMTAVAPTDADREILESGLTETIIPNWVALCGERCADLFNEVLAPIAGVEATP